ncbi:MAG: EAL domain-containing protein [Culicoidibacterales bacterium]
MREHDTIIKKIAILLICFLVLVCLPIHTQAREVEKEVVKVGFYEHFPYYYRDENNNPQGYYHQLLVLFARELQFDYQYVAVQPEQMLGKLESGEIDLGFGAIYTEERSKNFIYSRQPLQFESHAIYTHEKGSYGNITNLEGQTIGYLRAESNNSVFAEQIKALGVQVNLMEIESYDTLKQKFFNNEIDAIIVNNKNSDLKGYQAVYAFSTGPVYILTTKNNQALIQKIDDYIQKSEDSLFNPVLNTYNSFFNQGQRQKDFLLGISVILFILLFVGIIIYSKQDVQRLLLRKMVRTNLKKQRYCLYYQPIVHQRDEEIVSVEALLRLRKGTEIISPYHFLPQIEQAEMMYPVTLWIFEQVVNDYEQVTMCTKQQAFYISLNISFAELSHPNFLQDIQHILTSTSLNPQNFCFEIVERQKLTNDQEVLQVIRELQSHGFKIALDDFGTEYSNFDVLDKIPYDILKVDKHLVDTIETSFVKQTIIRFLTEIAVETQKRIVIEGIETKEQLAFLQLLPSETVFIQGYYYSPPQPIEKLLQLSNIGK